MRDSQTILRACQKEAEDYSLLTIATVVLVEGSTYRRPGARMLIFPNGRRLGSISGGSMSGTSTASAKAIGSSAGGSVVIGGADTGSAMGPAADSTNDGSAGMVSEWPDCRSTSSTYALSVKVSIGMVYSVSSAAVAMADASGRSAGTAVDRPVGGSTNGLPLIRSPTVALSEVGELFATTDAKVLRRPEGVAGLSGKLAATCR